MTVVTEPGIDWITKFAIRESELPFSDLPQFSKLYSNNFTKIQTCDNYFSISMLFLFVKVR